MPIIRVNCPNAAHSAEHKATLAPRLVQALIRQEIDAFTEIGTAATGFFFNELDRTGLSTHVRRRSRRPVQPAVGHRSPRQPHPQRALRPPRARYKPGRRLNRPVLRLRDIGAARFRQIQVRLPQSIDLKG